MFSSSMPSLFGRPDAVLTGNETLRSLIVELRQLRRSLSVGESHASSDARRLLSDFSAELYAYFDAEENDEYFGTIVVDCPALKRGVDKLGAAHAGFRDSVGLLRQLAGDETRRSELAVGIGRVIFDFEAHERAESAILGDYFRLVESDVV